MKHGARSGHPGLVDSPGRHRAALDVFLGPVSSSAVTGSLDPLGFGADHLQASSTLSSRVPTYVATTPVSVNCSE